MLIKGQDEYCCIFDLSHVILRVRAGSGGAWIDAGGHTVARYANKERALEVMEELFACLTNDAKATGYRMPKE
jgi:hypothetical protein